MPACHVLSVVSMAIGTKSARSTTFTVSSRRDLTNFFITIRLFQLSTITWEFTPWVNSVVVTPKLDRSIYLCLDPEDLNKAVKHNAYHTRTVDDAIPQVSGLTQFSILDACCGYWQVNLDKKAVSSAPSALLGENSGGISFHLDIDLQQETSSRKR